MDQNKIKILHVATTILRFWGVLPKNGVKLSLIEKITSIYLIINCSILTVICCIHITYNMGNNSISLEEAIEDVAVILSTIGTNILIAYISLNVKKIIAFVNELSNFSNFSLPPTAVETNRKVNILTATWTTSGMTGTIIYFIYKTVFDTTCSNNNVKYQRSDICGTLVPTYLPFSLDPKHYWILRLIEINAYLPAICAACTIVIFLIGCSEMIVVRIKHLNELIIHAVNEGEGSEDTERKLKICVRYHIHIIKLLDEFNDCYYWYQFVYFLQNSPLISMNGFNFILSTKISTGINFMGWFIALWLSCIAGQRLSDESLSINTTIYATNWYELDISLQKTLLLMMLRSQRALTVKAWLLGDSSLETLKVILKTSYSIITLLNTVMYDK
ncbi:odorant receptor 85b-like [Onthophagus taurus]|uniref:odorant receptor 85b-like n=1 Tax=Onthophagus taurus TaxID=166361 RepID=UPI0039BE49EA